MWQSITKWHRRFGIISAVFVIMLVITGIMLNHTQALNLGKHYIQSDLLLEMYNIQPANTPVSFNVNTHWVSQVGERVYLDEMEVAAEARQLVGAVLINKEIIVAIDHQLLLLNESGEIIERLGDSEGVPSGMRAVGVTGDNGLAIKGSHGIYLVDLDNLAWDEVSHANVVWSTSAAPPEILLDNLLQQYRGKGLPVERVILDLHSGRILGNRGVYLVDAAAILFLILAITGVMMWYKRATQ